MKSGKWKQEGQQPKPCTPTHRPRLLLRASSVRSPVPSPAVFFFFFLFDFHVSRFRRYSSSSPVALAESLPWPLLPAPDPLSYSSSSWGIQAPREKWIEKKRNENQHRNVHHRHTTTVSFSASSNQYWSSERSEHNHHHHLHAHTESSSSNAAVPAATRVQPAGPARSCPIQMPRRRVVLSNLIYGPSDSIYISYAAEVTCLGPGFGTSKFLFIGSVRLESDFNPDAKMMCPLV
jgi:hypothetical protein